MTEPDAIEQQRMYHAYTAHLLLKGREDALDDAAVDYRDTLAKADAERWKAYEDALAEYKDAVAEAHGVYSQGMSKLDQLTDQMAEYAAREDGQ